MKLGKKSILALVLGLSLVFAACATNGTESGSGARSGGSGAVTNAGTDPVEFRNAMRKLWEDHITWTRLFIVDAVAGSPETDATAARLLDNQADIGDAIKQFYGEAAGDDLTELLRGHILTAADLLTAAKAGDAAKLEAATKAWYENADDIAAFLSNANPDNWPLKDARSMMREHLDLTLAEAVAHLKGNYKRDIALYDKVHDHILMMADMLSDGIIAQFPEELDY